MIKPLTFFIIISLLFHGANSQVITPYGGYFQISKYQENNKYVTNLDAIVYFPDGSQIPDSFNLGLQGVHFKVCKSDSQRIYNGIIRQVYSLTNPRTLSDYPLIGGSFWDYTVYFIGKNKDTYYFQLEASIEQNFMSNPDINYSCYMKDFPLIKVEKNKNKVLNLVDFDPDGAIDSCRFWLHDGGVVGMSLNRLTGDIFIDANKFDTGYYSAGLIVDQFRTNGMYTYFRSTNFFTVQIVDERIPYFVVSNTIAKDYLNIPYIMVQETDKVINYQCDYINPKGFKAVSLDFQSLLIFNKTPQISFSRTNDTTIHINLDIYMDTGFYKVFERLPKSVSIIVTMPDSAGNYERDMTSFYLMRHFAESGINEEIGNNGIKIYPNPAVDETFITIDNYNSVPVQLVNVYDSRGLLLKKISRIHGETKINISELNRGFYLFEIIDVENNRFVKKIVKQ